MYFLLNSVHLQADVVQSNEFELQDVGPTVELESSVARQGELQLHLDLIDRT